MHTIKGCLTTRDKPQKGEEACRRRSSCTTNIRTKGMTACKIVMQSAARNCKAHSIVSGTVDSTMKSVVSGSFRIINMLRERNLKTLACVTMISISVFLGKILHVKFNMIDMRRCREAILCVRLIMMIGMSLHCGDIMQVWETVAMHMKMWHWGHSVRMHQKRMIFMKHTMIDIGMYRGTCIQPREFMKTKNMHQKKNMCIKHTFINTSALQQSHTWTEELTIAVRMYQKHMMRTKYAMMGISMCQERCKQTKEITIGTGRHQKGNMRVTESLCVWNQITMKQNSKCMTLSKAAPNYIMGMPLLKLMPHLTIKMSISSKADGNKVTLWRKDPNSPVNTVTIRTTVLTNTFPMLTVRYASHNSITTAKESKDTLEAPDLGTWAKMSLPLPNWAVKREIHISVRTVFVTKACMIDVRHIREQNWILQHTALQMDTRDMTHREGKRRTQNSDTCIICKRMRAILIMVCQKHNIKRTHIGMKLRAQFTKSKKESSPQPLLRILVQYTSSAMSVYKAWLCWLQTGDLCWYLGRRRREHGEVTGKRMMFWMMHDSSITTLLIKITI
jgi:hypothetical protein